MATFQFTYENSEMDFGSYSLGGGWLLTIETDDDGFSFRVIDAESCQRGVSREALAHIQEWADFDSAPRARGSDHKSLLRQAFVLAQIDRDDPDARADDRGCFDYHQRAA